MGDRVLDLHEEIEAAGVPIYGVSIANNGTVTVQYAESATEAQMTAAEAVIAGFDMRRRRPRGYAAIISAYQALSAGDQAKVRNLIIAHVLRENPRLMKLIDVMLDVEEVDA